MRFRLARQTTFLFSWIIGIGRVSSNCLVYAGRICSQNRSQNVFDAKLFLRLHRQIMLSVDFAASASCAWESPTLGHHRRLLLNTSFIMRWLVVANAVDNKKLWFVDTVTWVWNWSTRTKYTYPNTTSDTETFDTNYICHLKCLFVGVSSCLSPSYQSGYFSSTAVLIFRYTTSKCIDWQLVSMHTLISWMSFVPA
jgi:hypothetical protein